MIPIPKTVTDAVITAALIVLMLIVALVHRADRTRRIKRLADEYGVDAAIRLHREIEGSTAKSVVREFKERKQHGEQRGEQPPKCAAQSV